jgi:hypothetical protein
MQKQIRAALQENCHMWRTLFESAAEEVLVLDDAARREAVPGPITKYREIFPAPAHFGRVFQGDDAEVRCESGKRTNA